MRRVSAHVRQQNWLAVGLDFAIVVVGVFIGLQVSNWNDARQDRALEQEYLERLYDDMVGSIEAYQKDAGWDAYRLKTQDIVLDALRSGELEAAEREDFIRGVLFIGVHNPIRRQWGTVDELKSTGNIALLRDVELRNMIASADASYERRRQFVSESLARLSTYRANILSRIDPISYDFGTLDPAEAAFDFDDLAGDQTFINQYSNANLESRMLVTFSTGYVGEIRRIRDRLQTLLDDPSAEPQSPAKPD